ncbi:hypothetical protein OHD16_10810 [Sphingobacterium sp. ML3W]|uniref:hypothetical protein n=1 Tax=Sphingobacterium sp. ML3W TaxID=1538644 RepID=UPI00249AAEFC|nr:hypothetical protein [Sphingobacterium sp. ML3W]WFA80452.1 hypothetical protein OGI71_03955 [Sphingobacterium sp. ML3W]
MLKYLSVFAFSTLLVLSCSDKYEQLDQDDKDKEPKDETVKPLPLHLIADTKNAGIYDMVVFTLKDSTYKGPNESFVLPLMYSELDSLIWKIEGTSQKFNLLRQQAGGYSFTTEWGHNFYLPGTYTTVLSGYKDNKQVITDSTKMHISASADFLNVSWDQVKNLDQNTGYTSNGTLGYEFQILNRKKDDVLFSGLTVSFDSTDFRKPNPDLADKERETLSTYITQLYGKAAFEGDEAVLNQQFKQLFKSSVAKDKVLKIWKTKKSNIALLYRKREESDIFHYWVHAEPIG